MPDTAIIESAADLLSIVEGWSKHSTLATRYVQKLHEAATEGVIVGVLEAAVTAEALSDWEAAMLIPDDIYPGRDGVEVGDITDVREALCRSRPVVVPHDSRKGMTTYALHPKLVR